MIISYTAQRGKGHRFGAKFATQATTKVCVCYKSSPQFLDKSANWHAGQMSRRLPVLAVQHL